MVLPFQIQRLPGLNIPRSQPYMLPSPPIPTGRGPMPASDLILSVREDNFLDPRRVASRPLQLGDRVTSPFRQPTRGFGGFILGFVPGTGGTIVLWDSGAVTFDPLEELEPQSRREPARRPRAFRGPRAVITVGVGGGLRGGPRTMGVSYP